MFSTIQSVSRAKLSNLKANNPRDRAYPSWATSYPTVEFANIWAFRTRPGSD